MSDEEDYSSSDEDYVPSDGEAVSEEDNSGDEEDLEALHRESGLDDGGGGKGKKRKKASKDRQSDRKRKGGIKLDGEETEEAGKEGGQEEEGNKELQELIQKEQEVKKEEKEKKRADDLWSSFLSDVGSRPKPKPTPAQPAASNTVSPSVMGNQEKSLAPVSSSTAGKVKVTKEFDFAGEVVRVTKDVDVNSKEGQRELKKQADQSNETSGQGETTPQASTANTVTAPGISPLGARKPTGGLGSVLNKINRKDKMSTLEKSKLDWEGFKQKEGISDELQIHNRGKDGYIERMQFLNRTDQRQFEIERDLRLGTSSKR